jgi:formate-nitrite transporter family protein
VKAPSPREIWEESLDEGERRMKRQPLGQASTGLLGGFDVMLALTAVAVLSGALMTVTSDELAYAIGALPFGFAFIFLTIGRAELFTENFLVPVGAWFAGRGTLGELGRLWLVALVFNLAGIAFIGFFLTVPGVLSESALEAVGTLGQRFVDRGVGEALASAVLAGMAITLYTWLVLGARSEGTKLVAALAIGYLLILATFNHAVVSFGELTLGLYGGTTDATIGQVLSQLGLAIAGNTVGGIGFITMARLVQVRGEAHDSEHLARSRRRQRVQNEARPVPRRGAPGS